MRSGYSAHKLTLEVWVDEEGTVTTSSYLRHHRPWGTKDAQLVDLHVSPTGTSDVPELRQAALLIRDFWKDSRLF
jgi:hypothetical protein